MSRVLVLGNTCLDMVLPVPRLPHPGETLIAGALSRAPGGKGLNQAVVAARTGVPTLFRAAVGDDADGRFIAAALAPEPFAALRLTHAPGATDVSVILVEPGGENSIVSTERIAAAIDAADAAGFAAGAAPGDVLLLQAALAAAPTLAAAQAAAARGARVVFNAAPMTWPVAPLLAHCAAVVANQGEAEAITGQADPRAAAAALRAMMSAGDPALAVVTLGGQGCLLADAAGLHAFPAMPAVPVDTTGAGDTFCGALAAALAAGQDAAGAIGAAQRAAAVAVGRPGAYAALPTVAELGPLFTDQAMRAS
jgi:ribokinase